MSERDVWADWILRFGFGPQQGYEQARARASGRLGNGAQMLDRILDGAKIEPGAGVLDVGAGIGQIALEARTRAGIAGHVVALDISVDALRECRIESGFQDGELATISFVCAEALALPFADDTFDHITTRSVLIYVRDKGAAAREFRRCLRPGGRVSMFEPINKVSEKVDWLGPIDVPGHALVVAQQRDTERFLDEMCGFDERDLVAAFEDAGFDDVSLRYEYARRTLAPAERTPESVRALLTLRGNPGSKSYEEAAREVLGDGADAYLDAVAEAAPKTTSLVRSATAILNALRR